MVNLHDLYLGTIEAMLEADKLTVAHQPAGDKPSGVLWCMRKGTTQPEVIITYAFDPMSVDFVVSTRDMNRRLNKSAFYAGGLESFLAELTKFINAGRLAAPKGK